MATANLPELQDERDKRQYLRVVQQVRTEEKSKRTHVYTKLQTELDFAELRQGAESRDFVARARLEVRFPNHKFKITEAWMELASRVQQHP